MIPYFFPPMGGPRSIRMSYIAKYLNKWSWKVDVLSTFYNNYHEYDESIQKILPSGVGIYRSYDGPLDALEHFFCIDQQNYKVPSKISKTIRFIKKNLLIPDDSASWLPFAVFMGIKLIAKNKYDLIFTSSFPFSSHVVGYILKKLYNIPWIAEFSDPWSYNPITKRSGLEFIINKEIEETILRGTDGVIFMTDKTRQLYLERFGFLKENKTLVVPSGYDLDDYSTYIDEPKDKFTILYAGTIRKRTNILISFFKAINYLSSTMDDFNRDYEVLMVGKTKKEILPFLTEKTILTGYVNFLESLNYMKKSCVLLLLGNEGGVQIPSKVYYYLGAKRPILAILGDEYDPLKSCLSDINRVVIVNGFEKEIAVALANLYSLFKSGTLFKSFDLSDIEKFTWEYSLMSLNSFFKKAIEV